MTLDGAKRGRIGVVTALAALLAVVAHSHAVRGFFLQDDLWVLLRVSKWSASDALAKLLTGFSGPGENRAHGVGHLHFWICWQLFRLHYVPYALVNLAIHAAATALVVRLAWRLGGNLALAALAGVLFGVGGGAWEIAWLAAVQHEYAALAVAGMALGQLAYARRPAWPSAIATIALALLATISLESGAVVAMTPLAVELCTRRWWTPDGPPAARAGARLALALGACAIGVVRLVRFVNPAVLSGATPVGTYQVSLAPMTILDHLARIAGFMLLLPPWIAAAIVVTLVALGVRERLTRLPTVCGAGLALLAALPVSAIQGWIDHRFALVPSVGLALALSGGTLALAERAPSAARRLRTPIAAALGLVLAVHFGRGIHVRALRDAASARAQRDLATELPRLLDGRGRCDLVLYGLPPHPWQLPHDGTVEAPDFPIMPQYSIPLFLGEGRVRGAWIVDPRVKDELDLYSVRFVGSLPRVDGAKWCAFRFDGVDLEACKPPECAGSSARVAP